MAGASICVPSPSRGSGSRPADEMESENVMAGSVMHHDEHDEWVPPTGEQLASRLFGVTMAGVVAVIVLMALMGGWGSAA